MKKFCMLCFILIGMMHLSGFAFFNPDDVPIRFVHPGVINTASSLNFVAQQLDKNGAERTAAYQKVTDFINTHNVAQSYPDTVYVGSNGHTSPSKTQIRKDAELAYAFALRFAATGDIASARQAIGILNGWAYHFKKYEIIDSTDNKQQPSLEASWTTPTFVAAAEIIRYYKPKGNSANWAQKDMDQFGMYLNLLVTEYIDRVPNYKNNWNVSAGYAKMAIGVFLNDNTIYQGGKDMLNTVLPDVVQSDGTLPELCKRKDCVHFQYSLTGLTYAAEIARIQGDRQFYDSIAESIKAGYDFTRKAYEQKTDCNYCTLTKTIFGGAEVAYRNYTTDNMAYLRGLQFPLGVPGDNTFLGFTSYTHYNVPAK